jgi:hypothetical protein
LNLVSDTTRDLLILYGTLVALTMTFLFFSSDKESSEVQPADETRTSSPDYRDSENTYERSISTRKVAAVPIAVAIMAIVGVHI